jgi:HK97 family phage major capsid protein
VKIRKFYDAAQEAAGGAAVINAIKELGAEQKSHTEKLIAEAKAANAEEAKKTAEAVLETKAAEIQVKLDEVDKMRKEYEEKMAKQGTNFGATEQKSFNQHLAEAIEEKTDDIAKFERREKRSVIIEMKVVGDMTVSANYTGGSVFLTNQKPGIIANPARKLHVRDIPALPKGTTTGTRFDYLKESGAGEGAIAPVAETATKPQIDLDLVEATAPVEVIAGWLRISNKMLNNVPGLISFLQARLLEKLLIVEDDQLINGNGTSPNISGITDTGNFTAASASQALAKIEQLVLSISQLEELERTADAILLRPSDFWAMALTKASTSGEYDLPGIVTFADNQLRIAGVPAYRTTAMTADKYIVGDFGMGAMLLQRSAPRIELFREDGTNVRENKVTVRVEEEIAFPIFGSDYFIYGDFTA